MIKAIVFDLGNVVLTNDHPYNTSMELAEFCQYLGATFDNLDTAFEMSFPDYSLGKKTEDEFWEKFLYIARAKKLDIEYSKKFYRKNQKENEHMLELLKTLKNKYRIAALSTIPREWLDYKRERFGLDNYFEFIVSSGYSGLAKPDPKIYNLLIKKLQLESAAILFIDDKETYIAPAQDLGINTYIFRGQADLEKELAKRKLL
mgnify:CR=1 FL=1